MNFLKNISFGCSLIVLHTYITLISSMIVSLEQIDKRTRVVCVCRGLCVFVETPAAPLRPRVFSLVHTLRPRDAAIGFFRSAGGDFFRRSNETPKHTRSRTHAEYMNKNI